MEEKKKYCRISGKKCRYNSHMINDDNNVINKCSKGGLQWLTIIDNGKSLLNALSRCEMSEFCPDPKSAVSLDFGNHTFDAF